MKKSGLVLGAIVFVTLIFYLLAYYLLPPPPPSAAMMVLFAAVASALVWGLMAVARRLGPKKRSPEKNIQKKKVHTVLLLSGAGYLALGLCCTARAQAELVIATCKFTSGPRSGESMYYYAPSTAKIGALCVDGAGSSGSIVQVASMPIEAGKTSSTPSAPVEAARQSPLHLRRRHQSAVAVSARVSPQSPLHQLRQRLHLLLRLMKIPLLSPGLHLRLRPRHLHLHLLRQRRLRRQPAVVSASGAGEVEEGLEVAVSVVSGVEVVREVVLPQLCRASPGLLLCCRGRRKRWDMGSTATLC